MATEIPIKIQIVKSLSTANPSRIVAVKADGDTAFSLWVTDKTGIPYPLKDLQNNVIITNTDGNLQITSSSTSTNINLASSILATINSALQNGDNISELVNDSGYLTTFTETDPIFQASEASLFVSGDKANLDNQSGVNSGNQTSIVGISGTKAQFNTELTDGDFLFEGDITQYTDELAQDAVGNILTDSTTIDFTYNDTTPSISADVKLNSIDATHLANNINVSKFTNDSGYITLADVDGTDLTYSSSLTDGTIISSTGSDAIIPLASIVNAGLISPQEKQNIASAIQLEDLANVATSGNYEDLNNIPTTFNPTPHTHPISDIVNLQTNLDLKQDNLVSGTSIKTLEGQSLLGSGNINLTKLDVGLANVPDTDFTSAVAANTAKTTNQTHTGDATGATVLTLATVNSNVGSFGTASNVPQYTVNAKGLTTASANIPIQIAKSQVINLVADLSNKQATLVSGTNIRTINGNTLLGATDLTIPVATDATTLAKGIVQLAGDLGGTADNPTVPGLANKVDKVAGKSLIADAEITRLTTLSNYTHPTNHSPSVITQDASNRFVTDAEKTVWNAKQSAIGYTTENIANKNVANGYAGLGSDGKLISSQLPSITISDTYVVASQALMLGLTLAEKGDVAVRTDLNKSFILKGNSYSTLADWQELLTPTSAVTTVFGRNGAVTAQTGDYNTSQVAESIDKYYQTYNQKLYNDATSSIQTQLNAKQASGSYEIAFSKNTAFNKNFGTTAGTVVEGGTLGSNAYNSTAYAPLTGATLTGTPTAPTATAGTNTTQIATTAFVGSAIATADAGNVKTTGAQTITGTKTFNNSVAGGTGIFSNNLSTGNGIVSNNSSTGYGIYSANSSTGLGIYSANSSTGFGIFSNNLSTGYGIYSANSSTGNGIRSDNLSTGNGIVSNNSSTGTGLNYVGQNNGVNNFTVNKFGVTTASSFIATVGAVRLKNFTVATLPTGVQGDTAYVTDALSPARLTTVVGGGTVVCLVFFNGTNWVSY